MRYATADFQYGPEETPKPLLYLIASIGVVSILSTLLNGLFSYFLESTGPEELLGLSLRGMRDFFLWQPFTYIFTQNSYSAGISISYLISLCFNLYILWILGSAVIERIGLKSFFKLFFVSGIASGLIALLMMKLTSQSLILSGPGPAILALLCFWTLLYSEADLRFFFIFQLKAKWLTAGIFIAILLSCLSQLDFVSLGFYLTGMICGYLYGIIAYDLKGPFTFLNSFEEFILGLFKGKGKETSSKIVDINTGKALDDDIFVDAMLAKISKSGESSLTFYERKRLDEISKRKKM
jgi:membrane associated rhomboid family serine protease